MPTVRVTGHDASAEVRATAEQIRFCDDVTDTPGAAVMDADLVILCVPVGVMGPVASLSDDAEIPGCNGVAKGPEIGSAHVCTPVTTAQLVCRLLLDKKSYYPTRPQAH